MGVEGKNRTVEPQRLAKERWYEIENVEEVDSPALLVYPDRAEENIRRMVAMVENFVWGNFSNNWTKRWTFGPIG